MIQTSELPDSYALVTDVSRDECLQVAYRYYGREFSALLSLEEATRHANDMLLMVKALRKRAKIEARKAKGA